MQKVIHGQIWSEDFEQLNDIIKNYQSCVRFCYNRFHKDKMIFNNVRKLAKTKYTSLNARQIADAVVQAQGLQSRHKDNKIIFGGRKNWNNYKFGKITKEEWISKRDNQIYSRGESDKSGNLILRIIGNKLRVNIGIRKWIYYDLFISNKFQERLNELLKSGIAYNVRLIRKDTNHFKIMIDYKSEEIKQCINLNNGCIGIDTNPDRIAIANVSKDGNLIETKSLINNRILYGSTNKRDYDVSILVKQVINYAKDKNKGIVFENLNFNKNFNSYEKKWNRKKSNFVWRKFISLLERKCIENGIEYKKVNPAFTSVIGKYKYRWMHKINIHESAAYVIGRRGLAYQEKLSFYKTSHERLKQEIFKTLKEDVNQRYHSWRLWKKLDDNIETVLTALRVSLTDLKEFVGTIRNKSVNLLGETFLLEQIAGSNSITILTDERLSSNFFKVW